MQKYEIPLPFLQRKLRNLLMLWYHRTIQNVFEIPVLFANAFLRVLLCAIAGLISINKQTRGSLLSLSTDGCCDENRHHYAVVISGTTDDNSRGMHFAWETRRQDVKRRSRGAVTCKGWGTKDEGMCFGIYRPSSPIPRILFRARRAYVRDKNLRVMDISMHRRIDNCNIAILTC